MKATSTAFLSFACLVGAAHAQVYKCEAGGSVAYQQEPCETGRSKAVDVTPNTSDRLTSTRSSRYRVSSPQRPAASKCRFPWEGRLPPNTIVYAAGGYSGAPIPEVLDRSGERAGKFDIDVNRTDRPVALLLAAYDPSVWSIRTTAETRIVGIWASGYHKPIVVGIDPKVPVLLSSREEPSPCSGGAYGVGAANPLARMAFGRSAEAFYDLSKDKHVLVGAPLREGQKLSRVGPPYTLLVENTMQLPGEEGLRRLEQAGTIKKMTTNDYQYWVAMERACRGAVDVPPVANPSEPESVPSPPRNSYLVVKPFRFPTGLFGADAPRFYVRRGTEPPVGDRGHSTVVDANQMKCR